MLVEQIYKRKSIRKFKNAPIPREAAQTLIAWREWVHPLQDRLTIDNHIRRLPGDAHIKGMFLVNAPAYILYTSQKTPLSQVNAGFILEQISLGLGLFGVGSCFQGCAWPAQEHLRSLRFAPVMLMAYGIPDEPASRSVDEFKRNSIRQICRGELSDEMRNIVEAARLAPSAMNRQPWRLVVKDNKVHCYIVHSGIAHVKNMSELNLGIALSHMYLVVTEGGGRATFAQHRGAGLDMAPWGADYILTMTVT